MRPLALFHGLLALSATSVLSTARADPPIFGPDDYQLYDQGEHGIFPETKYRTTDLVGPHILRRHWDPACKSDDKYLIAPRGLLVGHPGPMLVDNDGYMVWHSEAWQVAYGLSVQRYLGENYLSFWSGNDQVIGHGSGSYYMVNIPQQTVPSSHITDTVVPLHS